MYENLSYEKLKELPGEQKKNALMELKEKYPHYKEMAEKIGGTPAALANLYLRIVEGRKPGRKKKEETASTTAGAVIENEAKLKRPKRKSVTPPDSRAIAPLDQQKELMVVPLKKAISFTISLKLEETGNEAKSRIEGIVSFLLSNRTYKIDLCVEEV